ncbi:MAG: hypothetical protein M1824_001970 [Vezdaea acicularis]|nr:MAG: hypothetical protein M1824_001970 [Vezdaea acicularis]
MPPAYSRIILAFPIHGADDVPKVEQTLSAGLTRLVQQIPQFSGKLVLQKGGRLEVHEHVVPKLVVSHLKDFPTFQELQAGKFPMSQLSEDLTPIGSMPGPDVLLPTLAVQANFISGGLLLCFCVHHALMDGSAYETSLKIWARACQPDDDQEANELPTSRSEDKELLTKGGRLDPSMATPAYTIYETLELKLAASMAPFKNGIPPMTACIFRFSLSSLSKLKQDATIDGSRVSTNDAVSALLWITISAIRAARVENDDKEISKLGMAVDGRSRTIPKLAPEYLGNVNIYSLAAMSFSDLTPSNLGNVAKEIRRSVSQIDDRHIRNVIAVIDSLSEVRTLAPSFQTFGKDLAITSWSKLGLYQTEWGILGRPVAVRMPKAAFDGLAIVLPQLPDGTLEVLVGLREDDMQLIRVDETFGKYATFCCQ